MNTHTEPTTKVICAICGAAPQAYHFLCQACEDECLQSLEAEVMMASFRAEFDQPPMTVQTVEGTRSVDDLPFD